jgi:hypothetical protein
MRQVFERLQFGAQLAPQNLEGAINQQVFQLVPQSFRELRVSLPKKFDGTRSKF